MKLLHRALILMFVASALTACGGDDAQQADSNATNDITVNVSDNEADDVIRGLADAMNQLGEDVETVSARDLFEFLPEAISGMTRGDYSSKKGGIEGFSVSSATAVFTEDNGPGELELSATDIGNVRGIAQFGLEMLKFEIDEVNQDGFQRTEPYKGFKSFQSSTKTRSGSESEMLVFVGDRIILKASGRDIDWELMQDVVDSIPVKKMAAMLK